MAGRFFRRPEKFTAPPSQTPLFPPSDVIPYPTVFIDREKTCPMLVRVFPKIGGHHSPKDFAVRGKEPKREFQIYTWKDATLRELTELVRQVNPEARNNGAWLSLALVFPNRNGCFKIKRIGQTFSQCTRKLDDDKSLAQLGFQIGDYLDVAIF